LPLAVPFPAQCAFSECLISGVQSTRPISRFAAISSKQAKPGASYKLQVLGEVKADSLVVIANKAPVLATVEAAHRAGMGWRPGSLKVQLQLVELVDHQKLPLQAKISSKGGPTGAVADWSRFVIDSGGRGLLLLPLAPLQHGNETIFPKGLVIEAETTAEIQLERSSVLAAQPPLPEKTHDGTHVTVYFLPHYWGSPSPAIWCGTANLGKAHSGRKVSFNLPRGKYFWHLGTRGTPLALQAEDGSNYHLKVIQTDRPDGGLMLNLTAMEHDVGELESADAQADEVADIAKLDLAKLQAEPTPKKHQ